MRKDVAQTYFMHFLAPQDFKEKDLKRTEYLALEGRTLIKGLICQLQKSNSCQKDITKCKNDVTYLFTILYKKIADDAKKKIICYYQMTRVSPYRD